MTDIEAQAKWRQIHPDHPTTQLIQRVAKAIREYDDGADGTGSYEGRAAAAIREYCRRV